MLHLVKNGRCKRLTLLLLSTKRLTTSSQNITSGSPLTCLSSCKEVSKYLEDPSWHRSYSIIDATWTEQSDGRDRHFATRIPGSKHFDLMECVNSDSSYPMMLPTQQDFEDYVSELGVSNNHHVLIYDNQPDFALFSSPRLWWMFRVFGHNNVSLMNGGLQSWIHQGYSVASGDYKAEEDLCKPDRKYKAAFRPELVKDFEFVNANATSTNPILLLESRTREMMEESAEKNRSPPHAVWTPFTSLLDADTNSILPRDAIAGYIADNNIDLNAEVVATCEIGLTAAIVSFCLFYSHGKDVAVYDGSLAEWNDLVPR